MYRFVLALRYLRARKITYFSVVGVAIGVMALIVVMAVMEGFQRDFKGRIRGTLSDVMIRYRGDEPIGAVLDKISSVPHVVAASPRLKGMALLSSRGRGAVEIVGVDPQREGLVSDLPEYVRKARAERTAAHALLYFENNVIDVQDKIAFEAELLARSGKADEAAMDAVRGKMDRARAFGRVVEGIIRKISTEGGPANVKQSFRDFHLAASESGLYTAEKLAALESEMKVRIELVDAEDKAARSEASAARGSELPFSSPTAREIIVGEELAARHLRVLVGEDVQMITGSARALPTSGQGAPQGIFKVVGTFKSGMYKADARVVYMPIAAAQEFTGREGKVSEIGVRLDDFANAPAAVAQLKVLFPDEDIRTWAEHRKTLIQAIHLEKAFLAVVLFMIVVVAGFVMLATFLMLVTEKTRDLGILSALGGRPAGITSIFLIACTFIGVFGSLAGAAAGLVISWNINAIEAAARSIGIPTPFPRELYYLDSIPVVVEGWEIFWIVAPTVLMCVLLGGVLPAIKASRLDPLDALRYE